MRNEGGYLEDEQMDEFRRLLENCSLTNLGWVGDKYAWCKGHEDGTFIRERLDRAVANHTWLSKYT